MRSGSNVSHGEPPERSEGDRTVLVQKTDYIPIEQKAEGDTANRAP